MYQGSYVAIVTPFKNDELDEVGLRKNLKFLIENNSSGIVACATTGEAPSLSDDEFDKVISISVDETRGKVPVIAGAGTNSTTKTIKLIHKVSELGVQGALVVTPYYNKPTQEGLYQHYKAVDKESGIPIIIYNVPGRTGCNILPNTVARLFKDCKNIKGIKEASGSLDQVSELQQLCTEKFDILSGDDSLTFPMLAIGAKGVISVVANAIPKEMALMCKLFLDGKVKEARALHLRMFPIMRALFLETNPIPVKKAMELMGMPAGKPRVPLSEMGQDNTLILKKALVEFGIKI